MIGDMILEGPVVPSEKDSDGTGLITEDVTEDVTPTAETS